MKVSAAIQARVVEKIKEGIALAEKHYNKTIPFPTLQYFTVGSTAGWATCGTWTMKLHAGLLMAPASQEEMINVTTPHELAHLICDRIYPDLNGGRRIVRTTRGYRREKRELHGPHWKEVMRVLGADDSRTHCMDTADFAKSKQKYDYRCADCEKAFTIGPKVHAQIVRSPFSRWCKCSVHPTGRGRLVLVQALGRVTYAQAAQIRAGVKAPVVQNPVAIVIKKPGLPDHVILSKQASPKKQAPVGDSKIAKCWKLYEKYQATYSRKTMLEWFVSNAGCTEAGAGTYYATCKKLWDEGVR